MGEGNAGDGAVGALAGSGASQCGVAKVAAGGEAAEMVLSALTDAGGGAARVSCAGSALGVSQAGFAAVPAASGCGAGAAARGSLTGEVGGADGLPVSWLTMGAASANHEGKAAAPLA
jgi:hypothetical protein